MGLIHFHKFPNISKISGSFRKISETLNVPGNFRTLAIAEGRGLNPVLVTAIDNYLQSIPNPFLAEFKKLGAEPSLEANLQFEVTNRQRDGPALGDRNRGVEVHGVLNLTEPRRVGTANLLSGSDQTHVHRTSMFSVHSWSPSSTFYYFLTGI